MNLDPYLSLVIKNRLTGDRRPYVRTKSSKMLKKSVNAYSETDIGKDFLTKTLKLPRISKWNLMKLRNFFTAG